MFTYELECTRMLCAVSVLLGTGSGSPVLLCVDLYIIRLKSGNLILHNTERTASDSELIPSGGSLT